MNRYVVLAICMAAVSLAGCGKDSSLPTASGKAGIRAINAIPGSPAIAMLIEESFTGEANYKSTTGTVRFDDLEYTFNFEVTLAGDTIPTRVESQLLDVVKDTDYTFLISGAIATPTITLWESDEPEWDGSETTFEARFANTSGSIGNVDVYFADASIPPAPGGELGTLAFGETTAPAQFETGEKLAQRRKTLG